LFSYKASVVAKPSAVVKTTKEEIAHYLSCTDILDPELFCVCCRFWFPCGRVFSVAKKKKLFRPRLSRMSAKVLSAVVFLKSNIDILPNFL
jgi:hypothetical protein